MHLLLDINILEGQHGAIVFGGVGLLRTWTILSRCSYDPRDPYDTHVAAETRIWLRTLVPGGVGHPGKKSQVLIRKFRVISERF